VRRATRGSTSSEAADGDGGNGSVTAARDVFVPRSGAVALVSVALY
jgi:hypothetical protein